jgi:single-stranded-DNA-specific exonuclease
MKVSISETIWLPKLLATDKELKYIVRSLGVHPLYARLLANRGITNHDDVKTFFNPEFSQLHDPFLMDQMEIAVNRILTALKNNERVMIFGDYDVDGTTGVALLYLFMDKLHSNIEYYIPDRNTEGYGISKTGIECAAETGCQLIVAIDCGIRSVELVDYARELKIDFIICDHHIPGEKIPDAKAVLDPKKPNCSYPFKELSGCGIVFKFCQAMARKLAIAPAELMPFLDLVAVSTCCDIVPLTGENRTLVALGIKRLNENPRPGLKVLMHGSEQNPSTSFNVSDVVFKIGPRINAAGRLESGSFAVQLLICNDYHSAMESAKLLNELNAERSVIDENITKEAIEMISLDLEYYKRKTTVVFSPLWHKGVIGIVASRLIEHYYRPTIVLSESDGVLTGSCRSILSVDIHEALCQCHDLIIQFGGHAHAAGLKIRKEDLESFRLKFDEVVSSKVTDEDMQPVLYFEGEWPLHLVNQKLWENLQRFAPFGPGNMEPVFLARAVYDTGFAKTIGKDHDHLKLNLVDDKMDSPLSAIAYKMGNLFTQIQNRQRFDILYNIGMNTFNGRSEIQIELKGLKFNS